jgi:hypothetical protein
VGDKHRREVNLVVKLAQPAAQFLADLGVEGAEGFVEEEDLRLDRERAGEGDALALPAGELGGKPGIEPLELHELQQRMHPLHDRVALRALAARADGEAKGDVLEHRHVPEQRVVLKHETHLALAGGHVRDVFPVEMNPAAARLGILQPGHDAQERGLARTRGTEQGDELAARHMQIDAVERGEGAKVFADVVDLNAHRWAAKAERRTSNVEL